MKSTLLLILAAAAALTNFSATAQPAYPNAPVHFVVPYAAGGTVDIVGRVVAQALATKLGQPGIVENKAGAGTLIAAEYVAKARPDGYTILVAPNTTLTVAPNLYKKSNFKIQQLAPIGLISTAQFVLTVNAKSPYKDLKSLVAAAKKNPEEFSFGSSGTGTILHIAGEMFNQSAGTKILHVPYKGSAPALADLLGNNITMMFDAIPAAAPQIKSGALRALAVTGSSRSPLFPSVPTIAESGWPQYKAEGWISLFAPSGIPQNVKETLTKALDAVRNDPAFQKQISDLGLDLATKADSDRLSDRVLNESALIQKVIQQANITSE